MKKYILLIALVVIAQVSNAQAQAHSDFRLAAEQLVQKLNSTLTLPRSERLAELNNTISYAQALFEQALNEGRSEDEIVYASRAVQFIADQQEETPVMSADEMAELMKNNDFRIN